MAEIAPLTPLRYDLSRLPSGPAAVVAPPYDVIDEALRAELAARDPHNVVQIDLPSGEGDARYENARTLLAAWRDKGVLVRDAEPAFYRYDQTFLPPGGGKAITRRGFLGLVRLHPFSDRVVLPHERTLSGPKEDRYRLTRATRAQLSPGFMLYRDPKGELDAPLETGDVLTEFSTGDGVHHVLAKVTATDAVVAIVDGLRKSSLLIADGHHRYETAVRMRDELDVETGAAAKERSEHRYFMTFLANGDDPKLVVFPTHRHVHSLPGASVDFAALVGKAAALFTVDQRSDKPTGEALAKWLAEAPSKPAFVVAAPDGRAARFALKPGVDLASHPTLGQVHEALRGTDVAVLHFGVLEAICGISQEAQAKKTNIWYPQDGTAALAELRGGKGQLLFLMNGTPVADVRRVAEAGEVMPQKSTFFYPKVLTGLLIHTLDPTRSVAL
jgi:uncharacterized protein (DUF1015 family)